MSEVSWFDPPEELAHELGIVREGARGLTSLDWEEIEDRIVELARVDPVCFIRYVFDWPMQACHIEWQDFLTENPRAILWAPVEHGKTSQCSVARPLFELGRNQNLRIALISNTEAQAAKALSVIKQQIELNPRLGRVFPMLKRERRPGRRQLWHDTAIIVRREDLDNKDPSVLALGVQSAIVGARIDLCIPDDILDFENTLTETGRKRTLDWFDASVQTRITAEGRIWFIGTTWHRDDAMEKMAKRPGWVSRRYDAEDNLWPELVRIGNAVYGWPRWRLEARRSEMTALEYARAYRNRPLASGVAVFHLEEIEPCYTNDAWDPEPSPSQQFYVGVDLNVSQKKGAAETCFFAGELRSDGVKRVQFIRAEVMQLANIVWWFYWLERRLHPVLFLVENNAAQDYVRQLFTPVLLGQLEQTHSLQAGALRAYAPRVEGFHTGKNKADPELGIRGMTLEFEQRRWRIPRHRETEKWASQLIDYDPTAHPGDVLMASWFFFSACTKYRPRRLRASSLGTSQEETNRERDRGGPPADPRLRLT